MNSLIERLAAWYARRFPGADREDLQQEGLLAALRDDAVSAISRAIHKEAFRQSVPVTVPVESNGSRMMVLRQQAGRSELVDVALVTDGELEDLDLQRRVLARVQECLDRCPELSPGMLVLQGEPAREVAADHGLEVAEVYRATRALKMRLQADRAIRRMRTEAWT